MVFMKLSDWLKASDMSAEAFGRKIERTGEAVRLWSAGKRMPGPLVAQKIFHATDGDVTIQDMHDAWIAQAPVAQTGGEA